LTTKPHVLRVVVHRHDHHRGFRADPAQFGQRVETAAAGHRQVEQHDVGQHLLSAQHRFVGVAGLGDHLDAVERIQQPAQACPHQRVVIANQHSQQTVFPRCDPSSHHSGGMRNRQKVTVVL